MRLAQRHREAREGKERETALVLLAFFFAFLVLAVLAARADASPASPASRVAAASFCGKARGVAADIVRATKVISPTSGGSLATLEQKEKVTLTAIASAAPALKSSAPHKIKRDLTKVLNFEGVLTNDLKQANWNFAALAPKETALVAGANRIEPSLARVRTYFRKTCKLDV